MPPPSVPKVLPSSIGNKIKRSEVYNKQRIAKQVEKRDRREKRKREDDELGENARPKQVPKTLESMRDFDETLVTGDDAEVVQDEDDDEFSGYFDGTATPKIMVTTQRWPSAKIFGLISEVLNVFPNSFYYKRAHFDLKRICKYASEKGFTHLIVLTERLKVPNGMIVSHLGYPGSALGSAATGAGGPTAAFRLSTTMLSKQIRNHGSQTDHIPEILLNNFTTRLGRRTGRLFASLFPAAKTEFRGRQVCTFHNQRDFIFFRQHRYMFTKEGTKAELQELGPRFTLRLKYVLSGIMDSKEGEYEWLHKKEQDLTRKTFHL